MSGSRKHVLKIYFSEESRKNTEKNNSWFQKTPFIRVHFEEC